MGTSVERKDVNYSPVKGQRDVKPFGFRVILSVAIIAMTDPTASSNPDVPTYDWKGKGTILSFWGYLWTQAFAGYAAKRFGAKWFLIGAIFVQSMLSLLTPLTAALLGSYGMCVSRALQGTCQGFVFPSVTHQLTQWVPPNERSRLGSVIFGSAPLGTVVAMLVTGVISAGWYGWPLVFYLYGVVGLGWCILFAFLGANSPSSHSSISKEEKYYIEQSLGHIGDKPTNKVPWKKIFTSIPLWAVFLAQTGNNYAFWTLLTQIPSYMNHVMHFDIKNVRLPTIHAD
ncbi:hypothetical protein HUJ04_011459 [Dendroctonus ponderosae]|nr:hypothetical protein HUJ04_011459 [Dendroctonus ponderosae]